MRPSVPLPTGTLIGLPVSRTSTPRARPSVASMATARTRSSPRCCWTSHTSVCESPLVPISISTAFMISGNLSGNTASMTTPVICSTRPMFFVLASTVSVSCSGFEGPVLCVS